MKKLLSLLLVLVMTLSLAVPMVSATEFTDVDKMHQYYDAIQSLVARGIISGMGDGTFAPEANIKRSEFAKMVVLSIGIANAGSAVESSGFPDVANDHWAAGFIKTAFGQGIINGFPDGSFKPDENVTYEQAVTMVIRAKSPILKAEAEKIGYPDGYLQLANKYRFLKGITDGVNNQPAKRGTIAKLMDNMVKIELTSDNMGGIPQIEAEQTEEVKGQVMAVRGTSLLAGDTDSLNTYQIKLKKANGDIVIFDAKNTSVKDSLRSYLGKNVVVYYDEDDGTNIQILNSIGEQKGRNYEVSISLDEIEDYSNTMVEYDDGEDVEKISIDSNAIIMYNGGLTTSDIDDLIDANLNKAGSIRFLSSEGDGSAADVIFFTSYTNWYVTSTTSSTKMVYGEIAGVKNNIEINDEARNKTVTITKNGNTVPFTSIQKGQILSISKSDDEKVIDVIISDKTVSGVVTGKEDSLNTITVQSKKYSFTDGLTVSGINLGVTLKLHLDAFGKVAKYTHQMVSTNYIYGYLLKANKSGSSMDSKVGLTILKLNTTSVASPAQLFLADTVTINNRNYKPGDDAENIIALLKTNAQEFDSTDGYDFGNDEVCQPVRYSTGSDGAINSLYIGIPADTATESDLRINRSFAAGDGVSCTSAGSSPQFNPHFKLNSSTPVVFVPTTPDKRANNLEYKIVTAGSAKFVQGTSYKMIAVDTTSLVPKAVIVYRDPNAVASTEWESCLPMFVAAKNEGTGEYPYEVTLKGYNSEDVYYDETDAFFDAVNIGDVVRVSAASDKKVEEYEIVAKAKEIYAGNEYIRPITNSVSDRVVDMYGASLNGTRSHFAEGDRSVTRKITMYAGVAYDIQEDGVTMRLVKEYPDADSPWTEASLTSSNTELINTSGAKVVAVDMSGAAVVEKDVEVIDVEKIQTYTHDGVQANADKLVVYCFGNTARLIVVYKNANE